MQMWKFIKTERSFESIFTNGFSELFKESKWASITRELVQNSIDALDDQDKKLEIVITLEEVDLEIFYQFRDLKKLIEGTLSIDKLPKRCKDFSENALNILNSNKIKVLKFSDYNTMGILGSSNITNIDSQWRALVYDEGNSQKQSKISGGSFGLGKNAPFAFSAISTVFYVTKDHIGNYAMQGVAKLNTSFDGSVTYEPKAYFGSYDETERKPKPFRCFDPETMIDIFRRDNVGSDILIFGVLDNWDIINLEIIKSIIDNFFYRIYMGKLDVKIGEKTITRENIFNFLSYYSEELEEEYNKHLMIGKSRYYLRILSKEFESKTYQENLEGLGDARLLLSKDKSIEGKYIAMLRNHGMKVYDHNVKSANQMISGIFIPGLEIDIFLREIENPNHDSFDPESRIDDINERKIAVDKLNRIKFWIKECVKEFTLIDSTDEIYIDFLRDYISFKDIVDERPKSIKSISISSHEKGNNSVYKKDRVNTDKINLGRFEPNGGKRRINELGSSLSGDKKTVDGQPGFIIEHYPSFIRTPISIKEGRKLSISFFTNEENIWEVCSLRVAIVGEDNSEDTNSNRIIEAYQNGVMLRIVNNSIHNILFSKRIDIDLVFIYEVDSKLKYYLYREISNEN